MSDAAVIDESHERPEVFARLYDRHAAEIHRYAARRLDDGVAEDITADTFLAAFRTRKRFDTGDAPLPERAWPAPGRRRLTETLERRTARRRPHTDWRLTAVGAAAAVAAAALIGGGLLPGDGGGDGPGPADGAGPWCCGTSPSAGRAMSRRTRRRPPR